MTASRFHRWISVLVGSICLSAAASPTIWAEPAEESWLSLEFSGLQIASNASEKDVLKLANRLDQFRGAVEELVSTGTVVVDQESGRKRPLTIVVFKDDQSFDSFKPLLGSIPISAAGYFQPMDHEDLILVSAETRESFRILLHEYTHRLTAKSSMTWPLWLCEGIAEAFSTFEVKKNSVTLGAPIDYHAHFLQTHELMPLRALFRVSRYSPEYNEADQTGAFYAQSWLLVHYLIYGNEGQRMGQFGRFLSLLEGGGESDAAFKKTFGADIGAIEKELRDYVMHVSLPFIEYELTDEAQQSWPVTRMAETDVECLKGTILMGINRLDESETHFRRAVELRAENQAAHLGLGRLETRRGHFRDAFDHFEAAIALDPDDPLAHYDYAVALEQGGSDRRKTTSELETVIRLRPTFADAYHRLGIVMLNSGRNLDEAQGMLLKAVQLEPQNKRFLAALAEVLVHRKDWPFARVIIEGLGGPDPDPTWKALADSLSRVVEAKSSQ